MGIRTVRRNYNFSDAFLKVRADSLSTSLNRDAAVLAEFGVTAAKITEITTLRTAFVAVGIDDTYMGAMMAKRQVREEKTEDLYKFVFHAATKVRANWVDDDSKEAEFAIRGNLSQQNAQDLLETAQACKDAFVKYQAGFAAAYNINAAFLTLFQTKIDDLRTAAAEYTTAANLRKSKTIDRITAGNALYDKMQILAQIGQDYWQFTNPAYYEEYVLNHGQPAPVQDLVVHADAGQTVPVPLNNVEADSNIFMENQTPTPGADATVYFAATPADPIPAENAILVPLAAENHLAGDLNYDPANTQLFIKNNSTVPIDMHFVLHG